MSSVDVVSPRDGDQIIRQDAVRTPVTAVSMSTVKLSRIRAFRPYSSIFANSAAMMQSHDCPTFRPSCRFAISLLMAAQDCSG
jgi:hypothetical protein